LSFNFAKINLICSHIAYQCDETFNYNPNKSKRVILKMRSTQERHHSYPEMMTQIEKI